MQVEGVIHISKVTVRENYRGGGGPGKLAAPLNMRSGFTWMHRFTTSPRLIYVFFLETLVDGSDKIVGGARTSLILRTD